jgi:hypothetical protein
MKIVRVRISGWAIQRDNEWMSFKTGKNWGWLYLPSQPSGFFAWSQNQADAYIFKRLSEAEAWLAAANSKKS